MENVEIARVFNEIADLLEIKGEDRFRIRSYRNAGIVIEGLPESLSALYNRSGDKGLVGIRGIGEGLRSKIVELLATGRCAYHDELLKELPAGIFDVLKVPGVGPRKAQQLYGDLGIASVDALEKAALDGRIRVLQGFGEASERKLIEAIRGLRALSGRFSLSMALPCANEIAEYLLVVPGVERVEIAGSLRRWRESVADIDLLAVSAAPAPVMDAFTTHPGVRDIAAKGDTKSSVVLKAGIQVDLRVIGGESFGAALQYFTGSKAHNIALRERAGKMGLKISEYGVFREGTGKRVAGGTEEDVYASVGLPWIPPELRENRGEIEAASKGTLPRMLEAKDLRGDLHIHTRDSDGAGTIDEMADAAMRLGYGYIAVTDHSKAVGVAHGLDEARALRQMDAVDAVNARLRKAGRRFRVLKGAEVDIRADGALDHTERVLSRLDCVVGAVHSGFNMDSARMTERIIKAIRSGRLNILAHPTGRLVGAREPYAVDIERVMDEAKRHGVAIELNSYPDRLDLGDAHLRLAKDKGVMVAISTDSHSALHLPNIVYGVHTARRGWIEKQDVLNARPLKELLNALKR